MHPCFSALPGEFIHKNKKLYMLFISPEIPRLVHPCYLGQMGAPANRGMSKLGFLCEHFSFSNFLALMLFMGPRGQNFFSKIMILAQIHPYKYSWTSILYTPCIALSKPCPLLLKFSFEFGK